MFAVISTLRRLLGRNKRSRRMKDMIMFSLTFCLARQSLRKYP